MEKPNKILLAIVAATLAAEGGFEYTLQMHSGPLVQLGFVEVNKAMVSPDNKGFATRATPAGIAFVQAYEATQNQTNQNQSGFVGQVENKTPVTKPLFAIDDNIPIPTDKPKRGAVGGNSQYPFDMLNVGQSFFVPDGDKKAVKTLASTLTTANVRYAKPVIPAQTRENRKGNIVPVTYQEREFMIRPDVVNGQTGARIWRKI